MAQLELIFHPANEAQNVVWGSDRRFLAIKEDGQHFQNFYVGYEGIFYMPNSEIKCPFNTVYFDILCGQSLSGLSQVFQCVKEVPVNMHRELTNIYIYIYIPLLWLHQFSSKKPSLYIYPIKWKLPVLSIHFLWKIEDKYIFLAECFLSHITNNFFAIIMSVSPFFHMLFYSFTKYVLCDRCCNIMTVTAITFVYPLSCHIAK